MAKQESFIKLKGKVGDLSFFKTKNGYQAREKGGVSADRIKNDPSYQRTRENNAEFKTVATTAKAIRDILRSMILQTRDPKMAVRLNSRLFRMIKSDSLSLRGERVVNAESFVVLKDFNFNEAAPLNNTLFVNTAQVVDRSSGVIELSMPELNAEVQLAKPKGATHCRFTAGAALISLDKQVEESAFSMATSDYETIAGTIAPITLSNSLPPGSVSPILVVYGVSFFQLVNGVYYSLNNGAFNALGIVAIDIL